MRTTDLINAFGDIDDNFFEDGETAVIRLKPVKPRTVIIKAAAAAACLALMGAGVFALARHNGLILPNDPASTVTDDRVYVGNYNGTLTVEPINSDPEFVTTARLRITVNGINGAPVDDIPVRLFVLSDGEPVPYYFEEELDYQLPHDIILQKDKETVLNVCVNADSDDYNLTFLAVGYPDELTEPLAGHRLALCCSLINGSGIVFSADDIGEYTQGGDCGIKLADDGSSVRLTVNTGKNTGTGSLVVFVDGKPFDCFDGQSHCVINCRNGSRTFNYTLPEGIFADGKPHSVLAVVSPNDGMSDDAFFSEKVFVQHADASAERLSLSEAKRIVDDGKANKSTISDIKAEFDKLQPSADYISKDGTEFEYWLAADTKVTVIFFDDREGEVMFEETNSYGNPTQLDVFINAR